MPRNPRPRNPRRKDIEELVAFLPKLYRDGLDPVRNWETGRSGETVQTAFPWPTYDETVGRFVDRIVSQDCWMDSDYDPEEAGRLINDAAYVRTATVQQIRVLLTYFVRGERFCEGLWGAMIRQGHIRRILERLDELGRNMPRHGRSARLPRG